MLLLAVAIGLLAGFGAVGFRWLIEWLKHTFWTTEDVSIAWIESLPWYWVVLVPAGGGLVVGAITQWFAPEAKGHGVPEVMEAVAKRNGRIRPRVVLAKAAASGICIASGGAVGREGPIVQIGSAIGSTVGQVLRMGPRRMRTLVGCGAAAAIAATFNAPVAGALFAVEVILGDFGVPQFSPIVISSVAATVVSHRFLGNLPAFEIPTYEMRTPWELLAYTALGLIAGLVAWIFVKTLCWHEDRFDELKWPMPVTACLGGLGVGGLALLVPGVLGVGYESMNSALMGTPGVAALGILLVAKLFAVCLTLGSGGSGGVFAPSLFLGAALGGLVGVVVNEIAPGVPAPPGAYALVGMGAMVAATTHAPITAILIIFEMTNDYHIMLPLMTACILSLLLATKLDKESIYTIKLMRRGVNVRAGQDINLLRNIPVSEVLVTDDLDTAAMGERLSSLMKRLTSGDIGCFYIVDDEQHLQGLVSMHEVRSILGDADVLADLVTAADIADRSFPSVSVRDSLDKVLTTLDLGYRDELPVLDGEKFVGLVRISDVLARYRVELSKRELAEAET